MCYLFLITLNMTFVFKEFPISYSDIFKLKCQVGTVSVTLEFSEHCIQSNKHLVNHVK